MKPQDLRIGNYVQIKATGELVKVEIITKSQMAFLGKDSLLHYRFMQQIEPVLIREVYNSLPTITELNWCDKALCEDLYYYKDIPLTYLHQLQNIHYALTGNEIEIEI